MRLAIFFGLFLLALSSIAPAADLTSQFKHLRASDEAGIVAELSAGRTPVAALSAKSALLARAGGLPVHAIYLINRGADERYVVVHDAFAKTHAADVDQLLRSLEAERADARPAVPGPAQTEQLRRLAAELGGAPALADAAATLVDRSSAKRALSQTTIRTSAFSDHW